MIYPFVLHWTKHPEGWLKAGINVTVSGKEVNLSYKVTSGLKG